MAVFLPQVANQVLTTSQQLTGLTVGVSHRLTYQLNPWHFSGTGQSCTLSTSFAGTVIDQQTLTGLTASQKGNGVWNQIAIDFVPASTDGELKFGLSCKYYNNQRVSGTTVNVWFNFDEVALVCI